MPRRLGLVAARAWTGSKNPKIYLPTVLRAVSITSLVARQCGATRKVTTFAYSQIRSDQLVKTC
eukprot:6190910-Pleurochrysis_carterae.AAC.1